MTAGFFSPLPPAKTGVAEYSESLLRALRARGRVEVAPRRADVNLYHIGNNQLHADIYRQAIEEPGVVVLHDAVLQHFALGYFARPAYIEEFAYNYGEWTRGLAADMWDRRARSGVDARYFHYPMLRRIAETSRAIIVHNPAAAQAVREHAPGARIIEIPHLFDPPPSRERANLGLPAGSIVLGVFGHLRESKRVMSVLRAFRDLAANAILLLAGDCASRDLARAIEPYSEDPRVRRIPFTPEAEFWKLAHATDICINLRYPSAGETSGIAVRFMGIGRTLIATRGPEVANFPDGTCVTIDPGVAEQSMLRETLQWLTSRPSDARAIGENAARYINEYHSIERVADLYWHALLNAR